MGVSLTQSQKELVRRLGVQLRETASPGAVRAAIAKALRDHSKRVLKANSAIQVGKFVQYNNQPHKVVQVDIAKCKAQLTPHGGGPMVWTLIINLEDAREVSVE